MPRRWWWPWHGAAEEEVPASNVAADLLPIPPWGSYEVTSYLPGGAVTRHHAGGPPLADLSREVQEDRVARAAEYYKSRGWVVDGGLRYGCDLVLYRGDPASCHAEYCVYLVGDSFNWLHIQGLVRIAERVHKGLLLCTVDDDYGVRDCCVARYTIAPEVGGATKRPAPSSSSSR
eukprot:Sspe_Gene.29975::Locus_14528_Transcript_1_1_Confidence_1.000_Length_785::g.29975::m.29975